MGLKWALENYDAEPSWLTIRQYLEAKDYGTLIDALKALRGESEQREKSDLRHRLHVALSDIHVELTAAGKEFSKTVLLETLRARFPDLSEAIPESESGLTKMWSEAGLGQLPQTRGYPPQSRLRDV